MRALVAVAVWAWAVAAADVIYHAFPRGRGVSRPLRKSIASVVRTHVQSAGHRLGPKRRAKYLLATRVGRDGDGYAVVVRFRAKRDKEAQQYAGTAAEGEVLATVKDLLERALPLSRERRAAREPALIPEPELPKGPIAIPAPMPPEPGKPVSTWVEDQRKWGDVTRAEGRLYPFPEPVEPPPKIGELPRR